MGRNRYVQQKPLTPAQQGYFLTKAFPQFRIKTARSVLRCVGVLQPTPTSDRYTIEVEYKVPVRPKVRVVRPELRLAPGHSRLPHVFEGNELCLHVQGDWRPDLLISDFIMPWISGWLFFYEVWLATGEWFGGGHEPTGTKR
jgi:hypothetical protein